VSGNPPDMDELNRDLPGKRRALLDRLHRCGCCGGRLASPECDLWCERCIPHTDRTGTLDLWDRSYYAQHGKPCPFSADDRGNEP
jgi:hypothetical protein